jgi:1,4-alpha-glucan branching enzyme/maltooligosyltrehalose trehalohydrolase
MRFGASLRGDAGGVDFRLWAPAAKQASVLVYDTGAAPASGSPPSRGFRNFVVHAARRDSSSWWECHVPDAGVGTLYHWRIDDELNVPDPASRSNPFGVHEPSCVVDPLAFDWDDGWTGRPWHEVVLYELHVGAFTPEGTFAAAAQRLQELKDIGVTAIELMPLAAFPGRFGWGYDGVLPYAPHAAYGSPQDLKAFIQQAHRLGLMVFLDVVYNHFGPEGNYLHRYAPQFFSATRSSPWGAAINFDGEGSRWVREFFIQNAVYWTTEYRFDGLRLDAVHAIQDDSTPHVLEELSRRVREATAGRHVHLVLEDENNHHRRLATEPVAGRFDGQWNDDFHHALHVTLTGETQSYYHDYGHTPGEEPIELLGRCLTHGMLFEDSKRKPGGAREEPRPTPPIPLSALVNFAHNHDQVGNRAFGERLAALVGPQAAPVATLLALLTPTVPMLFFGEEFGSLHPWLYFADWQGDLKKAVQEGRKREFGHVSKVVDGRELELPDPCSSATFDASRPGRDEGETAQGRAWLAMVKAALDARRKWIVPRATQLLTGQHTFQRVGATGLAVQWRYADSAVLELQVNLGPAPVAGARSLIVGDSTLADATPSSVIPAKAGIPGIPSAAAKAGDSRLRGNDDGDAADAQVIFQHAWPADAPDSPWPAWSARWRIGTEVTL